MHALLVPLGSTGDVLPFVGLGRALRARGHEVTVAANPHFAELVRRSGLYFEPLGDEDEYDALCDSPKFMDRTRGFRFVMDWVTTLIRPVYELAAAHRDSVVVAHTLAYGARVAEEKLGVRTATLLLSPAILRSADTWVKRSMRWAADRWIVDRVVGPPLNAFRAVKGLPPIARVLSHGWDGDHPFVAMFPSWFAPPQRDWPRRMTLPGFPLFDLDHRELDGLDALLDERPIVFTPGTGNRHAREFFAAAVDATRRLDRRALFLTAHPEQLPASLPPSVRHVSYLPLSRVLPRTSALVHHGGIGSAAAALAAGIPQVVVPFAHDQPDNAARLVRLGVAATLPSPRLAGAQLATAIEQLLGSPRVQAHCLDYALRLRDSDALGEAASFLERYGGHRAEIHAELRAGDAA
ncbi:MAG: glycosyl transferase [Myxococcales bacterium]|nr:glycosyl transferase [Myxococcales bacterium]